MPHRRLFPVVLSALLCLPAASASAQSALEKEAVRQLKFAAEEVQTGDFEKALASSDSAIRLNPALYDAYYYRALAYEGLGDPKLAEGLLITYFDMQTEERRLPEAQPALARVQEKLGVSASTFGGTEREQKVLLAPSDMPEMPLGSEEFLSWMVARQQWDMYQSRLQAGGAMLAAGAATAGVGAALMGITSALSVNSPDDPNIEGFYAGGVGALFSGGILAVVAIPTIAINGGNLSRMKKAREAGGSAARWDVGPTGLALRF